MTVIADTSVILNLCCVQQQELLRAIFREVIVPPEVSREFARATSAYPRFAGLSMPEWIRQNQRNDSYQPQKGKNASSGRSR